MTQKDMPIVTVITVVRNDIKGIEKTIQSVIQQSYPNIEYILIDGESTDGTVEVVKKFTKNISYFISEPDKGLYDAMNKGAKVATGEWIIFMNSGDRFHDSQILSKIFINNEEKIVNKSVVYSDTIAEFSKSKQRRTARSLKLIWMGPPACHQSTIIKRKYFKIKKFNLDYFVGADYDFAYFVFKNGGDFIYLNDLCISVVDSTSGVSKDTDPKKILIQNIQISRQYSRKHQYLCLYIINIFKYIYAILVMRVRRRWA